MLWYGTTVLPLEIPTKTDSGLALTNSGSYCKVMLKCAKDTETESTVCLSLSLSGFPAAVEMLVLCNVLYVSLRNTAPSQMRSTYLSTCTAKCKIGPQVCTTTRQSSGRA